MRIKESENLESLSSILSMDTKTSPDELSYLIINALILSDMIDPQEDYKTLTLRESIPGDTPFKDFCKVVFDLGIEPTFKNYMMFLDLEIIGDGDCPNCGGETIALDGRYKRIAGDGIYTPYEQSVIWEDQACPECGHKRTIGNKN